MSTGLDQDGGSPLTGCPDLVMRPILPKPRFLQLRVGVLDETRQLIASAWCPREREATALPERALGCRRSPGRPSRQTVTEAAGFASRKMGAHGDAERRSAALSTTHGGGGRQKARCRARGAQHSPALTMARHFSKHLTHTTASQPETRVLSATPLPG